MLECCSMLHSLDMQHDHVLKMNFDFLTSPPGSGRGGSLRVKYLLPCCCICVSLKSDMQHDHVLKKLNSDTGLRSKITFDIIHVYCTSVCMRNLNKDIDS